MAKKPLHEKLLTAEAAKHENFESFRKAYTQNIHHGLYFHLTDNPNFNVDEEKGPRDLSSMSSGTNVAKGDLMVTSHLENWHEHYNKSGKGITRPYVAVVDLSKSPKGTYTQVNRGFGNEFYVHGEGARQAKVTKVIPIKNALELSRRYHSKLPGSDEKLLKIYNDAKGISK